MGTTSISVHRTTPEVLALIQSVRKSKAELDLKLRALYGSQVITRLTVRNLPVKWNPGNNEQTDRRKSPMLVVGISSEEGVEQFMINKAGAVHLAPNPQDDNLYLFFTGQEGA